MARLKVPYFQWRSGRPRWHPGPGVRALGFTGRDLRNELGDWLGEGAAIELARELNRQVQEARSQPVPAEGPAGKVRKGIPRTPRTCAALWDAYSKSSRFGRLGASTRKDYRSKAGIFLDGFTGRDGAGIEGFGRFAVAAVDKPVMYGYSERLLEHKGAAMAAGIIAVARLMFSHAERIGWRRENSNPAFRLGMPGAAPRLRLATPAEIEALVAAADKARVPSVGDAILLALHSAQRRGDVLAMPDWIVADGRIRLRQFKRGAGVDVKLTPVLAARMGQARRRGRAIESERCRKLGRPERNELAIILSETTGEAWNGSTFSHSFGLVRAAAAASCPSLADLRFLDLRDTAITRLALAGCDKWQIASISGHSLVAIDTILKHYLVLGRAFADPAIDKLTAWMRREGIAL
ncbi:MAG TPA: hypothetical protein VGB90_09665 [Alphaproteobacteria bacterium]|jgi:integrase